MGRHAWGGMGHVARQPILRAETNAEAESEAESEVEAEAMAEA